MLTTNQMSVIVKELQLNLPPTLTTPEADAFRAATLHDLAELRAQGVAPDLPYDFFSDPDPVPLPVGTFTPTPPTAAEVEADNFRKLRFNLSNNMELARAFEADNEAVGEEARTLAAHITSLGGLTPTLQDELTKDITTRFGQHTYLGRWLRRLVRRAGQDAPPPRRRRRRRTARKP